MKIPVVQHDQFILYLERLDDCVVIHCDVLVRWTKAVKKNLSECFQKLTVNVGEPIYAMHTPSDTKHRKFLEMFGFTKYGDIYGVDGNKYDIYVWR